jgi:polysaccharide biosynthesis/export protein
MKRIFLACSCILFGCLSVFGQAEEYILQPGDVISVSVVEHPEFSGRHKIRPDGRINYPVIGELDVASLTCAQLVKIMEGKLSSYVNNPVVSVSIEEYYANKIFVIGAVNRTGVVEIYEPVDVMKAIAVCGGLKNPRTKVVKIIRADGTIVNISMNEVWGGGSNKRDSKKYVLFPGDTFYVPEPVQVPWGLIATILGVISVSLSLFLTTVSISRNGI